MWDWTPTQQPLNEWLIIFKNESNSTVRNIEQKNFFKKYGSLKNNQE